MSRPIPRWWVCCLLATGAVQPVDAQSVADQLKLCSAETDPARRLSCYDRVAGQPAATTTTEGAAPLPKPATMPPTVPAASAPAASAPAPSAAAAQPAKSAGASSNAAEFGVSNGPLAAKQQTKSLKSISAVVANVTARPRGELVVTLDNGQVWQQLAAVDYFPLKAGDAVEISSGALGSYVLSAPSRRSTKVTRIR